MPVPKYEASREELIETMRSSGPGYRPYETAKSFLELKNSEATAKLTKNLVIASWALALATLGLVVATIVLATKK